MTYLNYDPDNNLAGGLFAMTPKEAIRLGVGICEAVERAVGADGCHGGIWPGNITSADGQVAVGPSNRAGIAEMSGDMLEFVAPEQFWIGVTSPAADVYSIGLVLYTALNRGVQPYFEKSGEHTPEERADAMQNRMKGSGLAYPATAGRALAEVVMKAMAFQAGDRYQTPGQLKAALESLPEGAEVPAAVPVVPLSEQEKQNVPTYTVDKHFEKTETQKTGKKSKKNGASRRRAGTERLAALGLDQDGDSKTEQVMRTLVNGHTEADEPAGSVGTVPDAPEMDAFPETPPEPPVKHTKKNPGEVDENMDPEEFRSSGGEGWKRFIVPGLLALAVIVALIILLRGCRTQSPFPVETDVLETAEPVNTEGQIHAPVPETDYPGVTPEATPELTPELTPEVTEEPHPTYELFKADVSWEQARDLCQEKGGHLATVHNEEELNEIISLAEENGVQFVWLGAYRGESSTWYYVTGERMDYAVWDVGEPSAMDQDGTREDYLLLWYRAYTGVWRYNDQRNDPVSLLPHTYGGKTAYVCEYDG